MMADKPEMPKLPMPASLSSYSDKAHITNYFKQLHDKIDELNTIIINEAKP